MGGRRTLVVRGVQASRTSTQGGCREDGAEEGGESAFEDQSRSPPPQASSWSRTFCGIEDQGGLMAKAEEPMTQLATASRRNFTVASSSTA
jgi:hypothetical protein